MARSRRKAKKTRPKVRVGLPSRNRKAPMPPPVKLPNSSEILDWDRDSTLRQNYLSSGLNPNPNETMLVAASSKKQRTEAGEEADGGDDGSDRGEGSESEEDDELRAAVGKKRKSTQGRGLEPLTKMQRVHIGRLIEKHGDDYQGMARDIKLNKMQHPVGTLKFLCRRFQHFKYSLPS